MSEPLLQQLAERGYQARIVSIDHLHDLQEAIESGHREGRVDDDVYQRYLAGMVYQPPADMPDARSLIVVAYRDPQVRFTFGWKGERIRAAVPPTYLHGGEKDAQVGRLLAQLLTPSGYRVIRARVPLKLLAVRSGLAEYGKNNITYVAGLGGFHRLTAFYSDLPPERDEWQAPWMMARCKLCQACIKACPVNAITPEQVPLRAERCITFWNEKAWQEPFPGWLDAAGHNALVGCMHCQRTCPENCLASGWIEDGAEFSDEETALLAEGVPAVDLPAALVEKLGQWDLLDLLDVLPRNLKVLLQAKESEHSRSSR